MERLIQIVPELPPQIGGVAAYAELLAAALAPHGFDTLFLAARQPGRAPRRDLLEIEPQAEALAAALRTLAAAGTPTPDRQPTAGTPTPDRQPTAGTPTPDRQPTAGTPTPDRQPTAGTPTPDRQAAAGTPAPDCQAAAATAGGGPPRVRVLLHYVGYGYQRRGCPGWLAQGLRLAREQIELVTLFHEIWVGGPPWTHRFWLLPRQRGLVRRLADLSRWCVMNAPDAAAALRRLAPSAADRISVVPSPSTLGEPERAAWPVARKAQLLILGLPPARNRAYTLGRPALLRFCERAGIAEVHDIGPPLAQPPAPLAGLPLSVHGALPAAEVSRFLLASRALGVHYPRQAAAKSTLIAAGMASGCPVLNCAEALPADDGLSSFRTAGWDGRDWRQAGEEAYALYHRRRSWHTVADHLATCLRR